MSNEGIISILSQKDGLTFTVDTAADQVPINLAGVPSFSIDGVLQNIQYADSLIIEGFSLTLPYQFGQGIVSESMEFVLGYQDANAHSGFIQQIGSGSGTIIIPDPNVWFKFYAFVPTPNDVDITWWLELLDFTGSVSMKNVPADLDEEVLECQLNLKIRHTLNLTN